MKNPSRRTFATTLAAAVPLVATNKIIGAEKDKTITAASVPGDPAAPEVQEGTQREALPFNTALSFRARELPLKAVPFALTEVRLLPGPFLTAQEANARWLRSLSAERLVHTFRLNAGLSSPAKPLGGWEKPDCELRGHFAGHYLSACALMYAASGDPELLARGNQIVSELAVCQKRLSGGYLSAFPIEFFDRLNARKPVWAPFYTIHKIMAGLLDMHELTGNAQALDVLVGMSKWAGEWTGAIPEAHMQMVLDTEYGGMNEVLYNLAVISEDDSFAAIGDRFTKKRFFNPLAMRRDELRGLHTNTHIPQVIGAARRYEISDDSRFRDVADFFWTEIVETRAYSTGGTSNNEGWLVQPNRLAAELSAGYDTTECCCAYNMLKLTRQLYTWRADPRYFDYYERVLYNHRLGTIHPQTGTTQYYLGIVQGSWRTFGTEFDSFWCCNGTGAEEFSKLNNSIYFHSADAIYVNLFISSELNWRAKGIRLRQQTNFPEEARTRIQLSLDKPSSFALNLRVPAWVMASPAVSINGQRVDFSATPSSYLTLRRNWKSGDVVEISLRMDLRVERMPDDPSLVALCYGPLVLAGELKDETGPVLGHMGPDLKKFPPPSIPTLRIAAGAPEKSIRSADQPLSFSVPAQTGLIRFVPFYQVSNQRYSVYWRVA
jgi:hypothetical protein